MSKEKPNKDILDAPAKVYQKINQAIRESTVDKMDTDYVIPPNIIKTKPKTNKAKTKLKNKKKYAHRILPFETI
jgi:hypothetical protein